MRGSLEPDIGKHTVDLLINVEDEGPKAILGEIATSGAVRNSRESIIKYLGLTPGSPYDGAQLDAIREKLERSARFLGCDVTPGGNSSLSHVKRSRAGTGACPCSSATGLLSVPMPSITT